MKVEVKLSELLTLPNKALIVLALISGLILFLPIEFLKYVYMTELRENYGVIIGVSFLFSSISLIVNLIYTYSKIQKKKRDSKKFYDEAENRLNRLNDYQKFIIYFLYSQDNFTGLLPLHDGAIAALENNIMIGKATTQYMINNLNNATFPYLLQPWVTDELKNNPNLLNEFNRAFEAKKDQIHIKFY